MNDIRRTLLGVAFTMSLLMLWDRWHVYNGEPSMFSPRPARVAAPARPGPTVTNPTGVAGIPAVAGAAAGAAVPADGAASEPAPQQVTIQTDLVKATLDTRGGDVVGLELLKYEQADNHSELLVRARKLLGLSVAPAPQGNVQVFDTLGDQYYVAQTGLMPDKDGKNLPYHRTVMHLASPGRVLADGEKELELRFESPDVNGVQLVKTYTFHRGSYAVGVTHEVINHGTAPISPQLYLQLVRDGRVDTTGYFSGPSSYTGPAVYRDGTFHKVSFSDIDKGKEKDSIDSNAALDNGWIAMIRHYFSSAWILPPSTARSYSVAHLGAEVNGVPTYRVAMLTPLGAIAPGQSRRVEATLFAGPQEERLLEPLAPGLEQVKDYGMFKIIAQPLFWLLDKLHTLTGNWGWSIVALVVLLKIAFYGLNSSAYRSMAKMKAVNPRIQELRTRYKDNPQQQQQEIMKIYKEEKVNPLGGCLPIFIQMPIFFALFTVLTSSAEMRGAPWIGWIHDLSVMDPYGILPLMMTASGLAMVTLQPAPPDPMQARMMWIMPLVFSAALFSFPSGLVLYYTCNNLLQIAQQRLINRQINGPKPPRTPKPPKAGDVSEAKVARA